VIKELGTNGADFSMPTARIRFENPNPLTNFFELVLIFSIGSGLTYTLGQMTGSQRHGWAVWCAWPSCSWPASRRRIRRGARESAVTRPG